MQLDRIIVISYNIYVKNVRSYVYRVHIKVWLLKTSYLAFIAFWFPQNVNKIIKGFMNFVTEP